MFGKRKVSTFSANARFFAENVCTTEKENIIQTKYQIIVLCQLTKRMDLKAIRLWKMFLTSSTGILNLIVTGPG